MNSLQPLAIELSEEKYTRLVIDVPNADEMAKRINSVVARSRAGFNP